MDPVKPPEEEQTGKIEKKEEDNDVVINPNTVSNETGKEIDYQKLL